LFDPEIKTIKVLIGEVSLTRPPNILEAILGSCIGVALYDSREHLGGLAHVLLPNSEGREVGRLPGKYADVAVPRLIEAMCQFGASPNRIKAKLAGGARMFKTNAGSAGDIGARNIEAVKSALRSMRIPVLADDLGGETGRKVTFDLLEGVLRVDDFANRSLVL